MAQKKEFLHNRKAVTFLDLFAGAGGISEGFMQSYTDDKYYDFVLASDINENCELTHRVRYNKMLGLDTEFLCQDIMEDSFLPNLLAKIGDKKIDVVTGGPSCQSFSLAGRRKKLDKRDDLFEHYLKVIKALRPKYFVMENVKGILTKDGGRIKERILHEIRSIVDETKMDQLYSFLDSVFKGSVSPTLFSVINDQLHALTSKDPEAFENSLFDSLNQQVHDLTRTIPYDVSKSDADVATVRHGLLLLCMKKKRAAIRKEVIQLKTSAHIDNDSFVDAFNSIIETISDAEILEKTIKSLESIAHQYGCQERADILVESLDILTMTVDEIVDYVYDHLANDTAKTQFEAMMTKIRLYNIDEPIVVLSSNYGVAQNRERVLFIGCRHDQKQIKEIPFTVPSDEKVKVYEALWDLDMIGNGETVDKYKKVKPIKKYEKALTRRAVQGLPTNEGKLFSEWSKEGRLAHRFQFDIDPFYVRTMDDLNHPERYQFMELFNHQTSDQNSTVKERLSIIAKHGDYDEAKAELTAKGLDSKKRNYVVLDPEGQSPTVCTMPDDFIHYAAYRPTTVREMARLQSFDDTFVFQGKRQTGGNKRQQEIPQYTLVGNAVPPLMARAIGNTILEAIKLKK
ncbi:MAG: DNA cytosine methyltransferase [Bacteroidales bacterium]|nr:DNA cytosine methyltransferase [Bacteroidales bacterium]